MSRKNYQSYVNWSTGWLHDTYNGKSDRPAGAPHPLDEMRKTLPKKPPPLPPIDEDMNHG